MQNPFRFSSLSLAQQQWARVEAWLLTGQAEGLQGTPGLLRHARRRVAAALWQLAIALATMISLLLEVLGLLLVPLMGWVDAILGWVLLPLAAPLELLFSVPYVGRALAWLWRLALTALWGAFHLLEAPLVLIGVMPPRTLRLWVLLPEDKGVGGKLAAEWLQALQIAGQILQREANVKLMAVGPTSKPIDFQSGKTQGPTVEWLQHLPDLYQEQRIEVGCNRAALKDDLGRLGASFERWALAGHPRGSWRRLCGWGAPILALGVRTVSGGQLAGCSLGPLTDYITLRQEFPICLAHELGHACNLPHHNKAKNLMNPTCGGVHLSRWQVLLLRLSRHVTLF